MVKSTYDDLLTGELVIYTTPLSDPQSDFCGFFDVADESSTVRFTMTQHAK
jgi:hypothetical protein